MMNTHKTALLLFLFLAIVPAAVFAAQDFNITETSDFDAGMKSNSSDSYEIETSTDNPTILAGQIELANKKACDFTFDDDDAVNWKLKESAKQNTDIFERIIENNALFLNTTESKSRVGVDVTTKVAGEFSVQAEVLDWTYYDPSGGGQGEEEPAPTGLFTMPTGFFTFMPISGFITMFAILPTGDNPADIDYENTLRFSGGGRAYVMNNRTHVQFGVKKGASWKIKTSVAIYPNEISNGDKLSFKLVRNNTDEWFGYYRINEGSWVLIDSVSGTEVDNNGYVSLLYKRPKSADGPGVWFSHYKFDSVTFIEPAEAHQTSGTWVSAEQAIPQDMKMLETTFLYSGVDFDNYITLIEWINTSNNVVLANYSYDVVQGTLLTITDADLTDGTFDNVTSNFKIKLHFVGDGTTSPVVEEISGEYQLINTAPVPVVLTQNTTTTHSKNVSVLFKVTDSENNVTGATLFFDGQQAGNIGSVQNNTETTIVSSQQQLGMHWFWIEASDGMLAGTSENYTITIVNDAPSIYMKTANSTTTSNRTPEIQFNITDPENESVSAILFFNGTNVSENSSVENNTLTSLVPQNLSSGTYWFWIQASDGITTSTSLNYTLTINSVPESSVSVENETSTYSTTFPVTFSIIDTDDDVFSVTLFVDGSAVATELNVSNNTQTTMYVEDLSLGQHWFWLLVSDGKTSSTGSNYTMTVEEEPQIQSEAVPSSGGGGYVGTVFPQESAPEQPAEPVSEGPAEESGELFTEVGGTSLEGADEEEPEAPGPTGLVPILAERMDLVLFLVLVSSAIIFARNKIWKKLQEIFQSFIGRLAGSDPGY